MANHERGEVSFEASGKLWTMKFGNNALCEIEALTGKSMGEVLQLLGNEKTASITMMRAMLWGALQEHHEGISPKECSTLIDEIGMNVIGPKIGEAFAKAQPKAKEGASRPPKAATGA